MRKKMIWLIISLLLILGGVMLWGPIMSQVEQAKYTVFKTDDAIEIRDYAPHIIAQANISGERKEAINQGFRVIADYIFGNNTSSQKVAMTAPVIQQSSEKIAMTAPVMQAGGDNQWQVAFVMPAEYTMQTLPKPNNDQVKLIEMPSQRFAVIRFTGLAGEESLKTHTEKLQEFIDSEDLNPLSAPAYAFYNPPWTLPFMKRNEVMIEVSK
jgi:DNA gyrase inhibitor GyrI